MAFLAMAFVFVVAHKISLPASGQLAAFRGRSDR